MMTIDSLEIPTYAEKKARWEVRVDLSGKRYTFNVSWNVQQEAWTMRISDSNGELLIAGLRLVPGIDLLKKYRASCPTLPPGDLILFDKENRMNTAEVTRDNLSTRFALKYMVYREAD